MFDGIFTAGVVFNNRDKFKATIKNLPEVILTEKSVKIIGQGFGHVAILEQAIESFVDFIKFGIGRPDLSGFFKLLLEACLVTIEQGKLGRSNMPI